METTVNTTKKGLTTFDLKIMGIVLMFIDHFHEMFSNMGAPHWLNWFGRPVATIFFFVSVVGFTHTRNKEKYLLRLYIGFVIMNIGNSIISHFFQYGDIGLMNNIFADLFVGGLMMYGIDKIKEGRSTHKDGKTALGIILILLPIAASGIMIPIMSMMGSGSAPWLVKVLYFIPTLMTTENNIMVLLIPIMYLLKDHRVGQCVAIALTALLFFILGANQWMMIFAIIPILLYNGQKGRGMKYFFYIFYPAHIWILYIVASMIYNR